MERYFETLFRFKWLFLFVLVLVPSLGADYPIDQRAGPLPIRWDRVGR